MGSSEREDFEAELTKLYPGVNLTRSPDGYAHSATHPTLPMYASVQMLREVWQAARRAQASARPVAWINPTSDEVIRTERKAAWLAHGGGYQSIAEKYTQPLFAAPQQAQSDYVLQLLVAAGHVTQAKVDEAHAIANDLGISAGKEKTNG